MANEELRQAMLSDIEHIAEVENRPGVSLQQREIDDTIVVVARFWFAPKRGSEWRFYPDGVVTHYNWVDQEFHLVNEHRDGFTFQHKGNMANADEIFKSFGKFVRGTLRDGGIIL